MNVNWCIFIISVCFIKSYCNKYLYYLEVTEPFKNNFRKCVNGFFSKQEQRNVGIGFKNECKDIYNFVNISLIYQKEKDKRHELQQTQTRLFCRQTLT